VAAILAVAAAFIRLTASESTLDQVLLACYYAWNANDPVSTFDLTPRVTSENGRHPDAW